MSYWYDHYCGWSRPRASLYSRTGKHRPLDLTTGWPMKVYVCEPGKILRVPARLLSQNRTLVFCTLRGRRAICSRVVFHFETCSCTGKSRFSKWPKSGWIFRIYGLSFLQVYVLRDATSPCRWSESAHVFFYVQWIHMILMAREFNCAFVCSGFIPVLLRTITCMSISCA